MTKHVLSRRTFLMAAGVRVGVGASALLSWLPELFEHFEFRASVLLQYYRYLSTTLNAALFANQVDVSRVILVGHGYAGGHRGGDCRVDLSPGPVS